MYLQQLIEQLNSACMCSVVKVTFGESLPSPREFQTFIRESNVLQPSNNTSRALPFEVGHSRA